MRGCFSSVLDLAIARNIRLGGGRNLQVRVDMFNAPNTAGITGRVTSMTLTSTADPVNIQNLPYDANGNLIDARSRPRGAGFGVANGYQAARIDPGPGALLVLEREHGEELENTEKNNVDTPRRRRRGPEAWGWDPAPRSTRGHPAPPSGAGPRRGGGAPRP